MVMIITRKKCFHTHTMILYDHDDPFQMKCVIALLFSLECVAPKRSPGELEEEPWLDPKYLPPEVPPSSNEVIGGQRNPYATITPGVTMKTTQGPNVGPGGLENRGRFQGHKGTMAGRLKPATLASSYFPTS